MNFDVRAMCRGVCIVATTFALGALVASPAAAQQVYAYPLNGQSAKQQQNDEVACDRWAIDRTGFDPRQPPAYYGGQTGGGPRDRCKAVRSGVAPMVKAVVSRTPERAQELVRSAVRSLAMRVKARQSVRYPGYFSVASSARTRPKSVRPGSASRRSERRRRARNTMRGFDRCNPIIRAPTARA